MCAVPPCGEVLFFSSVFHSSPTLAACGADFMKERMKMALCAPCYLELYRHLTVSDAQLYRRYLGDCPVCFDTLNSVYNVLLVSFLHKPDTHQAKIKMGN